MRYKRSYRAGSNLAGALIPLVLLMLICRSHRLYVRTRDTGGSAVWAVLVVAVRWTFWIKVVLWLSRFLNELNSAGVR